MCLFAERPFDGAGADGRLFRLQHLPDHGDGMARCKGCLLQRFKIVSLTPPGTVVAQDLKEVLNLACGLERDYAGGNHLICSPLCPSMTDCGSTQNVIASRTVVLV